MNAATVSGLELIQDQLQLADLTVVAAPSWIFSPLLSITLTSCWGQGDRGTGGPGLYEWTVGIHIH